MSLSVAPSPFAAPLSTLNLYPEVGRSIGDEPNILETVLDLGARFLVPLQESDTETLSFGVAALVISSIASLISDVRREDLPVEDIELNISNAIENRNGESKDKLFFYQSELNKMQPIVENEENSISTNHFRRAMRAYEDFMIWAKQETNDEGDIFEDVLQVAVMKARGAENPADELYRLGGEIVSYIFGSLAGFVTSMIPSFW